MEKAANKDIIEVEEKLSNENVSQNIQNWNRHIKEGETLEITELYEAFQKKKTCNKIIDNIFYV